MGEKIRQRALRRLLRITLPDGKVLCYKRYNKNQYSEIIRAIFSVFCCGGDCMEDLNLYLKDTLTERPQTRVPTYGGRSLRR